MKRALFGLFFSAVLIIFLIGLYSNYGSASGFFYFYGFADVYRVEKYKIKEDNTLWNLFGKHWKIIARINNIKDPEKLFAGQVVKIPPNLESIVLYARKAAQRTGVRAELLLAMLEIESSWGTNIGNGHYQNNMKEEQHFAFLEICAELNLNPKDVLVSRKPRKYKGWGGAMGPAQFLPTEWLKFKTEISALTRRLSPSPWNMEDALTAMAVKLASAGGASRIKKYEKMALMIYFAGENWDNPRLQWYAEKILKAAEEINREIL